MVAIVWSPRHCPQYVRSGVVVVVVVVAAAVSCLAGGFFARLEALWFFTREQGDVLLVGAFSSYMLV